MCCHVRPVVSLRAEGAKKYWMLQNSSQVSRLLCRLTRRRIYLFSFIASPRCFPMTPTNKDIFSNILKIAREWQITHIKTGVCELAGVRGQATKWSSIQHELWGGHFVRRSLGVDALRQVVTGVMYFHGGCLPVLLHACGGANISITNLGKTW